MKYCQNPKCHYYSTNDRLKSSGENKTYQTRKASKFHYGNFCSSRCQNDWVEIYADRAIENFGRIITPKKRQKDTPDYWQLRNQIVGRIYGVDWNWKTNVDWHRVYQEMDIIMSQQNN
jgi:hypothetical protein